MVCSWSAGGRGRACRSGGRGRGRRRRRHDRRDALSDSITAWGSPSVQLTWQVSLFDPLCQTATRFQSAFNELFWG